MNKKLLLVFAALFSCSSAFAQTDEQWTVYDLQTNEQQTIDLTEEPLMIPTSVVGRDDRQDITSKATGFEKAAVVLARRNASGQVVNYCSGAMIGKNIVLTAAHCLTNKENNQQYAEVFVQATGLSKGERSLQDIIRAFQGKTNNDEAKPKRNKGESALYSRLINSVRKQAVASEPTAEPDAAGSSTSNNTLSAKAVQLWVPSQWDRSNGYNDRVKPFDYGLIILDSNLGDHTGWLNVAVKSKEDLLHKDIIVLGRGGDKPQQTLWRSDGRIQKVDAKFVYHDADTVGGNSGGPIVLEEDPYTIIALNNFHIASKGEKPSKTPRAPEGSSPNGGLRITNAILKAIQQNRK